MRRRTVAVCAAVSNTMGKSRLTCVRFCPRGFQAAPVQGGAEPQRQYGMRSAGEKPCGGGVGLSATSTPAHRPLLCSASRLSRVNSGCGSSTAVILACCIDEIGSCSSRASRSLCESTGAIGAVTPAGLGVRQPMGPALLSSE